LVLGTTALRAVLDLAGGDSFLSTLLGGGAPSVTAGLSVVWSSRHGLTFEGSGSLSTEVPVNVSVAGVTVTRLRLSVDVSGSGVGLAVSAVLDARLGPVRLSVDGVGVALALRTPGGFGDADFSLGFRPPTGAGLTLSAGPVTGGGAVGYDEATGRYSGAFAVQLNRISVRAVGLLDTRLPRGQRGFSLLVLLSARFLPGIQVGFGIVLTGVGGLVAVNRRIDVDALYERYATGAVGQLLASEDPTRNLPAVMADLAAIFPPADGVFVVGPTLQLQWLRVVTLDVGVFLEFPGPTRVVLLGTARASVDNPLADGPLLRLRADFVGVLDLAHRTLAFDAVLVDSRLLESFAVTGGLMLRAGWGDEPYVLFSAGGFHPDFSPGSLVVPRTLTRLAMSSGSPDDRLYLRFEGYFAITPNTVQFGAAVEVAAKLGPIRVKGFIGFDALIRLDPFSFQISFEAGMRAQWRGRTLLGLTVRGTLSGPGPVKFTGRACIEVLFFDICASASFELGSDAPPVTGPPPNVLDAIASELRDPATLRAFSEDAAVALRRLPRSVLPPTGIVWEQTRAPLGLLLERFEGTALGRAEAVEVVGDAVSGEESDWFAPGSFAELSDAEALNRRSFERLPSGVQVAAGPDRVSGAVRHTVAVREFLLPAPPPPPGQPGREPLAVPPWLAEAAQVRERRADGRRPPPRYRVEPERWQVLSPDGQVVAGVAEAQAHQLARTRGMVAVVSGDIVDVSGL
jgi:hypothetical protein